MNQPNFGGPRELRDNIDTLKGVLVANEKGQQVPLSQLGSFRVEVGAPSIKSEQSRPNAWVTLCANLRILIFRSPEISGNQRFSVFKFMVSLNNSKEMTYITVWKVCDSFPRLV